MSFTPPDLDWAGLSPVLALTVGLCVVVLAGLVRRAQRQVVSALTLITLASAAGLCIWQWGESKDLVAGALRLDDLALSISLICIGAAAFAVPLSWREPAAERPGSEPRHGEFQSLVLGSALGMVLLAQAQNLVSLFLAIELLSIPLYILCGSAIHRRKSLESGLKYLIIGALGSATLLYGLAFVYGAAGSTDFSEIRDGIADGVFDDSLLLIGVALCATGLAFKLSIAPFHQWTPDVYEGAPTPVTAFMAVATKAAAFAIFARLFLVALGPVVEHWDVALAVLATVSIAVGNIGALGQDSLKRLLAYSGIAQAGYMLVAIVVASELGLSALVFYLAAYGLMNLAAFGVIVVRERETGLGDDIRSVQGLGRDRPILAWPMTISMLALAGLPGTAGFIGKLFLIQAAVDADFTWLGVAIVVGTMISLAYYLRVVAYVWMRPALVSTALPADRPALPAMAGGAPGADRDAGEPAPETGSDREEMEPGAYGRPTGARCAVILGLTALAAAATVFFGVFPAPLTEWAQAAGESLQLLPT